MAKDDAEQTFKLLYSFLWVISQCLNFMCWCFKTVSFIFTGGVSRRIPPAYTIVEDGTERVLKRRHIKLRCAESPKRKNITFITWRKFQINTCLNWLHV